MNILPMFEAKPPEPVHTSAPSRALLQLAGVSKTFTNKTLALEGVDLTVRPGEFLTLLGPSGCGKSTLLKMIAGVSTPTTGTIDWPTSTYVALGEPDRSLGFVFQEPTLLPWRTVFDNVYLPLMLGGARRRYPRELSGGMRMRVSVARAIVTNPRILLMDEPFAALDEITRTKLNNDLMQLFANNNLTVIFVTHSVYESVYLSSRIVVMSARPGRMSTEIAISMPYPRNEDFRVSPVYNDYCRRASEALREAMAQSPAEPE
jgi:NitT/TauT family transport system ATP-binding protein